MMIKHKKTKRPSSRKKEENTDIWDGDDEIDWLAASFSTAYNNYEDEFGDIFGLEEEDEAEEDDWDADDYLLMHDDDEDDDESY